MDIPILDIVAIARMGLILAHILAVAAAGAAIAFGDYAIFAQNRIDTKLLHKAGVAVSATLIALWLTGLAVIGIDTGFDWASLSAKPKLLAKLSVVIVLSINGVALHKIAFRRLCSEQADPISAARLPAVLGAISIVTWLYAAFAGLAKPLAPLLGYAGFMALYVGAVALAVSVALAVMTPRLAARMARNLPQERRWLAQPRYHSTESARTQINRLLAQIDAILERHLPQQVQERVHVAGALKVAADRLMVRLSLQ